MKKYFLTVAALALVACFTSCKDDLTAPVITLGDTTAIVVDLGDQEAALVGVTANDDKDGDVTANIAVEGLEFVGNAGLTYTVTDAANNTASLVRAAMVSTGKLAGNYAVSSMDDAFPNDPAVTYNVTVAKSGNSETKLVISNFYDNQMSATFAGDNVGGLTMEPLTVTVGGIEGTITGTATYAKSTSQYTLLVVKWACEFPTTPASNFSMTETYTLR